MYKMSGARGERHGQMMSSCLIILFILSLDQFSKFYVEKLINVGESIPVIKEVFHISLIYNTGAAFGIFKAHPRAFIILAVIAVTGIIFLLIRKYRSLSIMERSALSFIMGGALGNLLDRLRFGHVVDFIDLRVWPVFNIADSCITIGAVLMAWQLLIHGSKKTKDDNRKSVTLNP